MHVKDQSGFAYVRDLEEAALKAARFQAKEREQRMFVVQEAYGVSHVIVARSSSECEQIMVSDLNIDLIRDRWAVCQTGPNGSYMVTGNDGGVAKELKLHLQERFGITC